MFIKIEFLKVSFSVCKCECDLHFLFPWTTARIQKHSLGSQSRLRCQWHEHQHLTEVPHSSLTTQHVWVICCSLGRDHLLPGWPQDPNSSRVVPDSWHMSQRVLKLKWHPVAVFMKGSPLAKQAWWPLADCVITVDFSSTDLSFLNKAFYCHALPVMTSSTCSGASLVSGSALGTPDSPDMKDKVTHHDKGLQQGGWCWCHPFLRKAFLQGPQQNNSPGTPILLHYITVLGFIHKNVHYL